MIWKAVILKKENKLDDAEKLARAAIAIDPSDGEEGPPDRMRAYAVLADVLEAKGKASDAQLFRNAVAAIRRSEQADRIYEAGLVSRALKMYEDALRTFADAYCIQSRLALRYSEMGMQEAAEEHYRRAYELMPKSFGRVESHCFGCEGVFRDTRGQNIAEQVFTKLAQSEPKKPQVHYLLGYLRAEEGNYSQAISSIREAVRLDPDYLNAWKKLQELAGEVLLSPKDRDEVALNILRLDPLGRHASPDERRISNLAALWKEAAHAVSLRPKKKEHLFELTASRKALEEREEAMKKSNPSYLVERRYEAAMNRNGPELKPVDYIKQQDLLAGALQMMDQLSMTGMAAY